MTLLDISWLEGVSWYVAVGAVLISVSYIKMRLAEAAKKPKELSGQWLVVPALTRRERVSRSLEPFVAFVACVAIWPVLVCLMVNARWFTERLPGPAEFKITREHLREVLSIESIETGARITDPLGAVPDLPFGHLNAAWEELKAGMQPGDTVATFIAPWEECGVMWECSGYAVVRAGNAVNFWVMGQKIAPHK